MLASLKRNKWKEMKKKHLKHKLDDEGKRKIVQGEKIIFFYLNNVFIGTRLRNFSP